MISFPKNVCSIIFSLLEKLYILLCNLFVQNILEYTTRRLRLYLIVIYDVIYEKGNFLLRQLIFSFSKAPSHHFAYTKVPGPFSVWRFWPCWSIRTASDLGPRTSPTLLKKSQSKVRCRQRWSRTKRRGSRKLPAPTSFSSAPPLSTPGLNGLRHGFFNSVTLKSNLRV